MVTSPLAWQIDLDAGPVHALDPGVEVGLRRGDVAVIFRLDARIRHAERHRALGERPVAGVLGGGAEPDPLVPETGRNAVLDHPLQHVVHGFVAHPVLEVSAGPYLLQSKEVAALVVHAGQAVADELLGDEGQRVAIAQPCLLCGVARPHADIVEHRPGAVGHPAVEFAVRVAVEGPGGRVGRVPGDPRQRHGLAVVIRGVTAAVTDGDRVFARHLIEVVNVERALVLHLGVVEEKSLDPKAWGRLAGFGAELVDDAGDGHELDLVGISDQDLVEQYRARRMIVGIDEPRHDRHLLGVECLGPLADQRLDVFGAPNRDEPAGLDRECLRLRRKRIDRVDPGVENDEIGLLRSIDRGGGSAGRPLRAQETGDPGPGQAHEISAVVAVLCHRRTPVILGASHNTSHAGVPTK